ncbi:MAG TPA: hypothetical protein DCO79_09745 [Spirochaeta sp.]|nr:hypothetical protein [Spirochaeta sp.]
MITQFIISNGDKIPSPALIFNEQAIKSNISKAIETAGGPTRLRPHVKTHKTREIVKMQQESGISKFKCATIAEAEMLGLCGAEDVLLAYPLVGPNVDRFIELVKSFTETEFSVVAESRRGAELLSAAAADSGVEIPVYLDLDPGLHRTGIEPGNSAIELYKYISKLPYLKAAGIHCYDGHIHQSELSVRAAAANECYQASLSVQHKIEESGMKAENLVIGGTPAFQIYAQFPDVQLSPGTCFLNDWDYAKNYKDMQFDFAAVVLTRVISVHPEQSCFTIDTGCKAIASDPDSARGLILELPDAQPLYQNEEHWVFKLITNELPEEGQILHVLPTHICPTSALYSQAHIINSKGDWYTNWKIEARNRRLSI